MNKWFGTIGFAWTELDPDNPGVYVEKKAERQYYGDILHFSQRWATVSDKENDDITVNNRISILSDPFAMNHFHQIRYVEWLGIKFKAVSIDVDYPRLTITLGGEYNGDPNE